MENSEEAQAHVDNLIATGRLRRGKRPSGPVAKPTLTWPNDGESLGDAAIRLRREERN